MDRCAGQAIACAEGASAVNVRCVPDPNRGAGSNSEDACTIVGECR